MNEKTFQEKKQMLLIDTSTPLLFLASAQRNTTGHWHTKEFCLYHQSREQDIWLKQAVESFIKNYFPQTPPLIAVGKGPGSFTSLRIGFTFVSVLTLLWQIPKMTFSSYRLLKRVLSHELAQKQNSVFLVRANRYLFFGEHQNKIIAWSATEWQQHYSSFLFFDYEKKENIIAEFPCASFVPFARTSINTINEENKNVFVQQATFQENFFIDDLLSYPQQDNTFPFEPEYGMNIVFNKKKDVHAI